MYQFENKIISSRISRFNVYLNVVDMHVTGVLYNKNYNFFMTFNGFSGMIATLDEFFNYVNFPQASHVARSFKKKKFSLNEKKPPASLRNASVSEIPEKEPDFILHVKFRRDATWQGTISIANEEKEFLSELELSGTFIKYLEEKMKKKCFETKVRLEGV